MFDKAKFGANFITRGKKNALFVGWFTDGEGVKHPVLAIDGYLDTFTMIDTSGRYLDEDSEFDIVATMPQDSNTI